MSRSRSNGITLRPLDPRIVVDAPRLRQSTCSYRARYSFTIQTVSNLTTNRRPTVFHFQSRTGQFFDGIVTRAHAPPAAQAPARTVWHPLEGQVGLGRPIARVCLASIPNQIAWAKRGRQIDRN